VLDFTAPLLEDAAQENRISALSRMIGGAELRVGRLMNLRRASQDVFPVWERTRELLEEAVLRRARCGVGQFSWVLSNVDNFFKFFSYALFLIWMAQRLSCKSRAEGGIGTEP
jgi:hypothetical protein